MTRFIVIFLVVSIVFVLVFVMLEGLGNNSHHVAHVAKSEPRVIEPFLPDSYSMGPQLPQYPIPEYKVKISSISHVSSFFGFFVASPLFSVFLGLGLYLAIGIPVTIYKQKRKLANGIS